MILKEIWDFMSTPLALYLSFFLILVTYLIYKILKNAKIKLLMADKRFEDIKLFAKGMTTPTAITTKGYIGFVLGPFVRPMVIHMKDILGYEVFFDGHSVERSGLVGKKELVFKDIASLMKHRLQERTRKIILAFFMSDDTTLNVYLFNTSRRVSTSMRDSTKAEMLQFFGALEEVEKTIKHK